jgi:hypothetical protein
VVAAFASVLEFVQTALQTLQGSRWTPVGFERNADGLEDRSRPLFSMANPNADIDKVLSQYRNQTMGDLTALKGVVEPLWNQHLAQQKQQQLAAAGGGVAGDDAADDAGGDHHDGHGDCDGDCDDEPPPPPLPSGFVGMQRVGSLDIGMLEDLANSAASPRHTFSLSRDTSCQSDGGSDCLGIPGAAITGAQVAMWAEVPAPGLLANFVARAPREDPPDGTHV